MNLYPKLGEKMKTNDNKELKAGISYIISNIFSRGVTFLIVPIVTRILTTDEYGQYSLYITAAGFLSILIGLSLHSSIAVKYNDDKENFDSFLSSILFFSLLVFFAVCGIVVAFNSQIFDLTGFPLGVQLILCLYAFFTYVIIFNNNKYVVKNEYKTSTFISIGNSILTVVAALIFIFFIPIKKNIGLIYGISIIPIILGFVIMINLFFKGKYFVNIKTWKYALLIALPVVPHLLSHQLLSQFDRFIINKYDGANLGYYSLAITVGGLIQLVISGINTAWVPFFFKKLKDNNQKEINIKSKWLIALVLMGAVGLIFIMPEVIKLIAPPNYNQIIYVVPFLVLSFFIQFMYTFFVDIQFYLKKTYLIPVATFIAAIISIVLNYLLVPIHGYLVSGIVSLLSYTTLFCIHYFIVSKIYKVKIFKLIQFLLMLILGFAAVGIFYSIYEEIIIRYISITIMVVLYFVWMYNQIKKYKNEEK